MIRLLRRSELQDFFMHSLKYISTFRAMISAFRENSALQPFMHLYFYNAFMNISMTECFMHQSPGFNRQRNQANERQTDSKVKTGRSCPCFFFFRNLLTVMPTRPCRLYIDKSEGHKMESMGPSVRPHLPAACI